VIDAIDAAIQKTGVVITKLKLFKAGLLHDLLTRGIDHNGELRDPHAHPEQFKDSLLGRVPAAWGVEILEKALLGRPKNGYSPQEADDWNGSYMLGLGCLTPEGFAPCQLKNAPAGDPKLEAARLYQGDLLVSRSNTKDLVALAGVFRDIGVPCTYPDLMMRLKPNNRVAVSFLEAVLMHPPVRRAILRHASGTSGSMVKISADRLLRVPVILPPVWEQQAILEKAQQIRTTISNEQALHHKLRLLKQGLMHDLLTGRVRVPLGLSATP
jgi:type I restriction enzyme S subunit